MKNIGLFMLLFLFFGTASFAQNQDKTGNEVEGKTYKAKAGKKIQLDLGEAIIEGYAGKEIVFTSLNQAKKEDERAKGLRAINGLGLEDNTGLGIQVTEQNGIVHVRQLNHTNPPKLRVQVPHDMIIAFEHQSQFGDTVIFRNVQSEIEVSSMYNDLEFENITGPATIKNVYGDIHAVFNQNVKGPLSIVSIHGDMDITVPTTIKADLKMTTRFGELLAAPELKIKVDTTDDMQSYNANAVNGKINAGGLALDLRADYGKIYLRSK